MTTITKTITASPLSLSSGFLIGAISSILAVLLTKSVDFFISKITNDRELNFLAIQLILLFDDYASICVNNISNHENALSSDGQLGAYLTQVSDLAILPSSDAYKFLDHKILESVFSFSVVIKSFKDSDVFFATVFDDDELQQHRVRSATHLGIKAAELADKIKCRYKLLQKQSLQEDQTVPKHILNTLKHLKMIEKKYGPLIATSENT